MNQQIAERPELQSPYVILSPQYSPLPRPRSQNTVHDTIKLPARKKTLVPLMPMCCLEHVLKSIETPHLSSLIRGHQRPSSFPTGLCNIRIISILTREGPRRC